MADTVGGLAGVERVNTCDSAAWDAYPAKLEERRREHFEAEVASSQTNFAHLHQIPASTISSTQAFDAVTYRSNLLLDANSHYARCEFTVQHQGLTIGARLIPLQEIERVVVVYEETPMRTDMAGSVRIMLTGGLSISVARGTLQISSLSDVCGQLNGVAAVLASYVGGASLEKGSTEEIPEGLRKLRSTVRGC